MRRMWTNPGRIIVSRPGYQAGPTLPDQYKILDSDWQFSGLIIAKGTVVDPAPADGGGIGAFRTNSTTPIVINFPSPGYIPTAVLLNRHSEHGIADMNIPPAWDVITDGPFVAAVHGVLATNHITIPRVPQGAYYVRYPGVIEYTVYALGPD